MMKIFPALFLFAITLMAGCTDGGRERRMMMDPGAIFPDYRIWSEEGKEDVTCLFQFRMGGPDGKAVLLEEPASITLDGERLLPDSTRLTGGFYEIIKPLGEFKGEHTVIYTDVKNEQHKLKFEFLPFGLSAELPERIGRKDFSVKLAGFPPGKTPVHIMLTDTAFATNDVNEIIEAEEGRIKITRAMLDRLKAGPVVFEIFREHTRSLQNGSKERGRVWTSYGLRREFELVD